MTALVTNDYGQDETRNVSLQEPTSPKYIWVNPETNVVHLLMPIVSGKDIGMDNTCKSTYALQQFFGITPSDLDPSPSALDELRRYQIALESDLKILPKTHELYASKLDRLEQIEKYTQYLTIISTPGNIKILTNRIGEHGLLEYGDYPSFVKELMETPTNLYSIVLKPRVQDPIVRTTNPIFSVHRAPYESVLFTTLINAYSAIMQELKNPRDRVIEAVLQLHQDKPIVLQDIQRDLTKTIQNLFHVHVDFRTDLSDRVITDERMAQFTTGNTDTDLEDYIAGLVHSCCDSSLWTLIDESPFLSPENNPMGVDKLSIITQFFLAQANIYCYSNQLSHDNFGKTLDHSKELSELLAMTVISAIQSQKKPDETNKQLVEASICQFINDNASTFGLAQKLTPDNITDIIQQFTSQYTLVKESPHFDEFKSLDNNKPGNCVFHQGNICADFANIMYFRQIEHMQKVVTDFNSFRQKITGTNDWIPTQAQLVIVKPPSPPPPSRPSPRHDAIKQDCPIPLNPLADDHTTQRSVLPNRSLHMTPALLHQAMARLTPVSSSQPQDWPIPLNPLAEAMLNMRARIAAREEQVAHHDTDDNEWLDNADDHTTQHVNNAYTAAEPSVIHSRTNMPYVSNHAASNARPLVETHRDMPVSSLETGQYMRERLRAMRQQIETDENEDEDEFDDSYADHTAEESSLVSSESDRQHPASALESLQRRPTTVEHMREHMMARRRALEGDSDLEQSDNEDDFRL